jgi:uncharacterized protein YbaA (DUF1428 family)
MSKYVDGFVIPIAKDKVEACRAIAEKASKLWKEHGALEYRECVLEDSVTKDTLPFPRLASTRDGETVIFAYITFHSCAHRDEVNAKVMADLRLHEMCGPDSVPFECSRMAYGGFETIVEA